MKAIVIVFIISLFVEIHSKPNKDDALREKIEQKCIEESGVDRNLVNDLKKKKKNITLPRAFFCFTACEFIALDLMEEDGSIKIETIMSVARLSKEDAEKAIDKCNINTGDSCSNAQKLLTCDEIFKVLNNKDEA